MPTKISGGLRLHRARQDSHLDLVAGSALNPDRLAPPELAHRLDPFGEELVATGKAIREEDEVVGMPTGSEGDPHPPPCARRRG